MSRSPQLRVTALILLGIGCCTTALLLSDTGSRAVVWLLTASAAAVGG